MIKIRRLPGSYVCSHMVLEKPLEGLHIVVDAGNGAGGFFVVIPLLPYLHYLFLSNAPFLVLELMLFLDQDKVLKPLGAITTGSQFLEPDGNICTFSSCR